MNHGSGSQDNSTGWPRQRNFIERAWSAWVNPTWSGQAKGGVPLGARNFGRVRSTLLNGAFMGDLDRDGVPDSLDIDKNGNLILRTRASDGQYTQYFYDGRNRLTEIDDHAANGFIYHLAHYVYDAFDRRIEKVDDADGNDPDPAITTATARCSSTPGTRVPRRCRRRTRARPFLST